MITKAVLCDNIAHRQNEPRHTCVVWQRRLPAKRCRCRHDGGGALCEMQLKRHRVWQNDSNARRKCCRKERLCIYYMHILLCTLCLVQHLCWQSALCGRLTFLYTARWYLLLLLCSHIHTHIMQHEVDTSKPFCLLGAYQFLGASTDHRKYMECTIHTAHAGDGFTVTLLLLVKNSVTLEQLTKTTATTR